MFGEKYSRKEFEAAQKKLENPGLAAFEQEKELRETARNVQATAHQQARQRERTGTYQVDSDKLMEESVDLERQADKIDPTEIRKTAQKKLDGLLKAGHKEALKLNEKYDKLSARAEDLRVAAQSAEKELEKFVREELRG